MTQSVQLAQAAWRDFMAARRQHADSRPQPVEPQQPGIRPGVIRAVLDKSAVTLTDMHGGLRTLLSCDPIPPYWLRQLQHDASVCHAAPELEGWLRTAGVTCRIVIVSDAE